MEAADGERGDAHCIELSNTQEFDALPEVVDPEHLRRLYAGLVSLLVVASTALAGAPHGRLSGGFDQDVLQRCWARTGFVRRRGRFVAS